MLLVAGVIIGYVPIQFTLELILLGGAFTAIGVVIAMLVFLTGVIALFTAAVPNRGIRRRLSTILGIIGIAFSVLSLVGTLGGLFAGLLLGVFGGSLCIDWTLLLKKREKEKDHRVM